MFDWRVLILALQEYYVYVMLLMQYLRVRHKQTAPTRK